MSLASFFDNRHKDKQPEENTQLLSLFSQKIQDQNQARLPKKSNLKIKKNKKEMVQQSDEDDEEEVQQKPIKISKALKPKKIAHEEMKPQTNNIVQEKEEEPENLDSTIFVGNVPLDTNHSQLKKIFNSYGKIIKVWFRSIPVDESKLPRKAKHILKKYQEGADSMNAYIKFNTQQQAKNACVANGQLFKEKNIRVSLCQQFEIDFDSTIFIGNLPHKVRDQDLWEAFAHIGKIKNVRVIRNKQTREGIGIAYIRFETKQEMKKAVEMKGKLIGGREMRIKKAVTKERIEKKARKMKEKKINKFKSSLGPKKNNKQDKQTPNQSHAQEQAQKAQNIAKTKPINKNNNYSNQNNTHQNKPFPNKSNLVIKPQKKIQK